MTPVLDQGPTYRLGSSSVPAYLQSQLPLQTESLFPFLILTDFRHTLKFSDLFFFCLYLLFYVCPPTPFKLLENRDHVLPSQGY